MKIIDPALSQEEQSTKSSSEQSLEFRGTAREYFRIWIVNLCLTLLTFGIFSAWAKVRKKRYLYSQTILGGTPFQYLGQPIPILKGRAIAAIGFLIYYISGHFFTSLLPYVLVAGLLAAPWVIVRSAAFNARYSAFRNMTFHFDGKYLQAAKVLYLWSVIPVLAIAPVILGMMSHQASKSRSVVLGIVGVTSFVLLMLFPWWMKRFKNFIIQNTSYGGRNGVFSATGGQFFEIYFTSCLIMLAVAIPTGLSASLLFGSKNLPSPYVFSIPMYLGYILAYAFMRARSGNLVWNHTALGPLRFQSTLRCGGLLKLYFTNAVGIVASLGLLIPWAVVRTVKYRADNMRVLQVGELTEFEGSDLRSVAAVGAEALDFFDVDLSL
jgi:uncharacterized membrane protein YjgN (DUF898 family)